MKDLVFYHADCADGFGAAFAAWLRLGDSAEYVPVKYGQFETAADLGMKFDPQFGERKVFILDFSFNRPVMDYLFRVAEHVTWLDHHKTAFEMWCRKAPDLFFTTHKESDQRKIIVLDDCKSGALLAWEHFHPNKTVPMMIQHIDDRDRWQFRLENTREFSAALFARRPWSFEDWHRMFVQTYVPHGGSTSEMLRLYHEGHAILRAHDQDVVSAVKQARKCKLRVTINDDPKKVPVSIDYHGLAVNCPPSLSSDVGHALAKQCGAYGLCWSLDKDGVAQCSLRSTGDYDVSAIAKCYGGGGHRNAAGFRTTFDELKTILGL